MDAFLERVFLAAAHLVSAIGGWGAVLLIGLLPVYAIVYFRWMRKVPFFYSLGTALCYGGALTVSMLLLAILWITAIALGAWG